MSVSSCNDQIADCGRDEMSIHKSCAPFTVTSQYSGNYPEYAVGTEDEAWPVIGQQSTFQSPYECIQSCNVTDSCGAARYNYNTGTCTLLDTSSPAAIIDRSNEESKCIGLFVKDKNTGPKNCTTSNPDKNCQNMSVAIKSDQILNIDMANAKPAKTIQRIQSDWSGAPCRELAADGKIPPDNKDVLDGMGQFCKDNPNFKVCNQFCNNDIYTDFCQVKSSTKLMIVFIALFFLFLLVFILVRVKGKKRMSYIFGGLTGVFLGLSVWKVVEYIRSKGGEYNGNKKDYPMSVAPSSKYCVDNNFVCRNHTAPKGQRCVSVPPGNKGTDRTTCEALCCPPGFTANTKDGKCYQDTPDGDIGWYSSLEHSCSCQYHQPVGQLGVDPCTHTCPVGYSGINAQHWPKCSLPSKKAYKGDMYCTGAEYPKGIECHDMFSITKKPQWKECTNSECTLENILSPYYEPGDGGKSKPVFCPPPPS